MALYVVETCTYVFLCTSVVLLKYNHVQMGFRNVSQMKQFLNKSNIFDKNKDTDKKKVAKF